jgi:hypothetical protein
LTKDSRAAVETFRATLGADPSAAQAHRGAVGVVRTLQRSSNASPEAHLDGGCRDPRSTRGIHEQGERPW